MKKLAITLGLILAKLAIALGLILAVVIIGAVLIQEEKEKFTPELKKNIESLIKKLGSEKQKEREEVTEELANQLRDFGEPVIEQLKKALKSKDPGVKEGAKRLLWECCRFYEVTWPEEGEIVKGLQLTISSNKKTYKVSENITIKLTFKNVDKNNDIYICKNLDGTFPIATYYYQIARSTFLGKKEIPHMISCGQLFKKPRPLAKHDFIRLRFQQNYEKEIVGEASVTDTLIKGKEVRCIALSTPAMPSRYNSIRCHWYEWDLAPGKYIIAIIYRSDNDGKKFGLNAWTGMVISNTITIEIKK